MIIAFLGFTFLIAALFPFGPQLAQFAGVGMYGGVFKGSPPIAFHLFTLLITYLPAALVTAWFFGGAKLKARLPSPVPGASLMLFGVALTLLFILARLLASIVPGGGPGFVVAQFGPLALWPARILLAVGAVKLLLAARAT